MKHTYKLQRLIKGEWETILFTRHKNYPCCGKYERVIHI